jgi:hypothetical protein
MAHQVRAEKRRFLRIPIDLPVIFMARDSWVRTAGVAKDISVGGMFIETAQPPAYGASIHVEFTPLGERRPLLLSATVRWSGARGIGVQFGLLGARETHAITELQRASATSSGERRRG